MIEIVIALISSATTLFVAFLAKKRSYSKSKNDILSIIDDPNFKEITLHIKTRSKIKNKITGSLSEKNPKIDYEINWNNQVDLKKWDQSKMDNLINKIERFIYG